MYRYTIRPQFGHGPAIHRGSAFQAWPQYGQSTMISASTAGALIASPALTRPAPAKYFRGYFAFGSASNGIGCAAAGFRRG